MHAILRLTGILFILSTVTSCNNNEHIPFPSKELGYAAPETVPLVFTKPKPLTWDTVKTGGIKPTVKKLDIETLPSVPFDSTGFKPFAQAPKEGRFDFNQLPDTAFSLSGLASHSLELTTTVLNPPVITKTLRPGASKNFPLSIYDLGVIQGMPAKFIGCLFKDSNGFLWIGSGEGLFRYDGQHVQTIISGTSGIPIVGITEDNKGNIWFANYNSISTVNTKKGTISTSPKITTLSNNIGKMTTDSDGNIWVYNFKERAVSIIDPASGTYKNLDRKTGLSDSLAFEIAQDNDKRIWITTYTGGTNIVDIKGGKIQYLNKTNGLSSNNLSGITTDKDGKVLLASNDGFDVLDIKSGTAKYYGKAQGLQSFYTLGLTVDSTGQVWRNTVGGIEVVNINKGAIRYINKKDGLGSDVVASVVEDKWNRMWIGSIAGLNMLEQYGKTATALYNTNIISLVEDPLGNVWVAKADGIGIVNPQRTRMRLLSQANGLADNFVQSFTKSNGNMIVATNSGFNIVDPVRKTILTIGKKEGFTKDTLYSIFRDNMSNIWFTGPGNGVALFDSSKNSVLHTDKAHGLSDDVILDTRQDMNGRYWLATRSNGINVYDRSTGTVSYINDQPGLKDTSNKILLTDSYGRIWIGTYNGVYMADIKANTLTHISTLQGLSHNKILSLLEYNGSILAGTSNKINSITAPAPGSKTDTAWKVSIVKGSEGLLKTSTSWSSDCITGKGEYLWGDNGIAIINSIQPATGSANSFVVGISVMNQPQHFVRGSKDTAHHRAYADGQVFSWDSVEGAYNMPVNLVIPYKKNYLQFQYGEAGLSRQDTTWYSYLLEGIDKNWSTPTINTVTENYLNLPPGKYSFKVCSRGIDGKWGNPAHFDFTISPPWYQSWWAYTLFALLAAALLRAYIVYRSRRLQDENRILEEKVALRTSQLEKSLEDLKATQTQLIQSEKMASLGELTAGIAHEIQNPLNFINNFSEVNTELIAEMKEEISKGNMEEVVALAADIQLNEQKINHHGKRADSIVKGMLQHSRSNNGQKELTDINALCDEYLRLSYHGLRAKDKSFNAKYETHFDTSIEKMNMVPQDMGRVILNLLTNAFYVVDEKKKSGIADYQPTVSISTKKLVDKPSFPRVEIRVTDNGNGIPPKVLEKIFQPFFTTKPTGQGTGLGLSLSYDIVKAHGGELKVETKESAGTTFIIILPV
jgi:signal transduction histidine kinase/ligand-binding sensor domain-containing protein